MPNFQEIMFSLNLRSKGTMKVREVNEVVFNLKDQ